MPDPPTGRATFFFTDIQGSTAMWKRDAKRMQRTLARHDEIPRSAIETSALGGRNDMTRTPILKGLHRKAHAG